jgi:hypothetical protein
MTSHKSSAELPCPQTALDIFSISTGRGHLWTASGFVFVAEAECHSAAVANPRFYAFDLLWHHGEDLSLTAVTSLPLGH